MALFPAPIGGTVLANDFAPSILFAVLYSTLMPLMFRRLWYRQFRCTLLIGTIIFSIERIALFHIRSQAALAQERNGFSSFSSSIMTYQQISFGMGFIAIASDVVRLARSLLVNATYGPEKYSESSAAAKGGGVSPPSADTTPDQPRARSMYRLSTGFLGLAFLIAVIIGIIGNSNYSKSIDINQSNADLTANLRIASTAIAIGLSCIVVHITFRGFQKLPRVNKRGVTIIGVIYTLIIMIGTYRLSVMWIKTTSLTASSPLNTPGSKALFYIFHVLPEWLATLILLGIDVRETFGTGLFGDWRLWDERKKERVKRLARRKENRMNSTDSEVVEMKEQV